MLTASYVAVVSSLNTCTGGTKVTVPRPTGLMTGEETGVKCLTRYKLQQRGTPSTGPGDLPRSEPRLGRRRQGKAWGPGGGRRAFKPQWCLLPSDPSSLTQPHREHPRRPCKQKAPPREDSAQVSVGHPSPPAGGRSHLLGLCPPCTRA